MPRRDSTGGRGAVLSDGLKARAETAPRGRTSGTPCDHWVVVRPPAEVGPTGVVWWSAMSSSEEVWAGDRQKEGEREDT